MVSFSSKLVLLVLSVGAAPITGELRGVIGRRLVEKPDDVCKKTLTITKVSFEWRDLVGSAASNPVQACVDDCGFSCTAGATYDALINSGEDNPASFTFGDIDDGCKSPVTLKADLDVGSGISIQSGTEFKIADITHHNELTPKGRAISEAKLVVTITIDGTEYPFTYKFKIRNTSDNGGYKDDTNTIVFDPDPAEIRTMDGRAFELDLKRYADDSGDGFTVVGDTMSVEEKKTGISALYADLVFLECPPQPAETNSPTSAPTDTPPSMYGDPHIKAWSGKSFDFHGGCDLVLLDNPSFHDGLGMAIHVRTHIVSWWSHIATAAIKIGDDILEITGGEEGKYYINGVERDTDEKGQVFSKLGLKITTKRATKKQLRVRIDLLNGDAIGFETYKTFVRVNFKENDPKWKKFAGSVGLMGRYPAGQTLGRDGTTVFTDMNAFGKEWQVRATEPKLFRLVEGPQHPETCLMPNTLTSEEKRRRLGTSMITHEDAELACAPIGGGAGPDFDACVFDVLATNDKDMAGSY